MPNCKEHNEISNIVNLIHSVFSANDPKDFIKKIILSFSTGWIFANLPDILEPSLIILITEVFVIVGHS